MPFLARSIATAVVVMSVFPAVTLAEGWKMPNLNPFARRDSHPANVRLADEHEDAWWKPKLPSLSTSRTSRRSQPSTWTKLSRGTKSAWAKTSDALNPFDDESDKPQPITGYNTAFSRSYRKPEKKSSWWPSWGSEEPKRVETVQDFLDLDRPD